MTKANPTLTIVEPAAPGDPGSEPARPARRPKLATVVREHILADIRSGRWRPGDRIPTELELMARFGVSRAPIREAMQSLHLLGHRRHLAAPRRGRAGAAGRSRSWISPSCRARWTANGP